MDGYRIAHRSLDTIRDQMLQQCIAPRRSNLEKMIHVFFACTFLLKGHRELDKPLAVPLSHSAAASVPCIEVRQLTATRFTVPEKYEAPAGEVELTFRDPDNILVQLQDVTYCGGEGKLGERCGRSV